MKQYKELLQRILDEGEQRQDRTGVGTKSIFGHQLKFDLTQGFPLVSLKKTIWRSAFYEMIWFLCGDTNIKYLNYRGIKIWDEWADKDGNIGPGYGASLRQWKYLSKDVDQFEEFVNGLLSNPFSRRHIMTTWHPGRTEEMNLPPCHGLVLQGYISKGNKNNIPLGYCCNSSVEYEAQTGADGRDHPGDCEIYFDLHMYQRSCDTVLGLPFNIAEWAFFMHLIGKLTHYIPRNLIISLGDAHIYSNHFDGVKKMLERQPIEQNIQLLIKKDVRSIKDIQNLEIDLDVEVVGYKHHPFIKFEVAV